jgi:hypothetical protein
VAETSSINLRSLLAGPVLCTGLLVAMSFENRSYRNEREFEPFHARAQTAIDSIPLVIGPWMGLKKDLRPEELNLLKPNAFRSITYSDTSASALADRSRSVHLLIAQCKRANYMENHWPPNCYPAMGYMLLDERERTWTVGSTSIRGYEYLFEQRDRGRVTRQTVYNFMVLPQKGIQPDMKAISASAEDYQQRYYGAAQIQVVFAGSLAEAGARDERDGIFAELMTPCLPVIRTLSEGDIEP